MTKICLYCGQAISGGRSNKKYCNDSCKQQAFYKRSGLALSAIDSQPNDKIHKQEAKESPGINYKAEPFNGKDDYKQNSTAVAKAVSATELLNVKNVQPFNDTTLPTEESQEVKTAAEPLYEWIEPALISAIDACIEASDIAMLQFKRPGDYWGPYTLPTVLWVSQRLRCLVENLLCLSSNTVTACTTLIAVQEALNAMVSSRYYYILPDNYPFTKLIKDLLEKLTQLVQRYKRKQSLRFRISVDLKAELIATRFILASSIPWIPFHELNFKE